MKRAPIRPEIKAKAIADLLTGEQPAIVAERYGIDAAKVRVWKQRYVTAHVTEDVTPPVTAPGRAVTIRPAIEAQQLAIGELVMDNLRAKLLATQGIAEYVRTPAWIDKQTASDMAELFEIIDRAAIGILDRLAHRSGADDSAARADDRE